MILGTLLVAQGKLKGTCYISKYKENKKLPDPEILLNLLELSLMLVDVATDHFDIALFRQLSYCHQLSSIFFIKFLRPFLYKITQRELLSGK